MKLDELLKKLAEGFNQRGVRDGTGPFKGSAMASSGRVGPRMGRKLGDCPMRNDFKSDEEYNKALAKWKKTQKQA